VLATRAPRSAQLDPLLAARHLDSVFFAEFFALMRHEGLALNKHFGGDSAMIFKHACALSCEGIVSKRLASPYRAGRSPHWLKIKNPTAPAMRREGEEDWSR
jgi:hypothetical protein